MYAHRILCGFTAGLLSLWQLSVTVSLVALAFLHIASATAGEEEVRVGVTGHWSVNWPIYILSEQLAARKGPLRVRLIEFTDMFDAEEALAKQIIHVWAPAPTESVLRVWRDGTPIAIGASLTRRAPYFLVTGAKVRDPKELRDLTIGISPLALAQEMEHLKTLENYGLKLFEDYILEPTFDSVAKVISIESGKIAAAYVINDIVYELDDSTFNRFGSNTDFLEFPLDVVAFNRDWAKDDSGEVSVQVHQFIDALRDAMYVLSNPEEKGFAIKILMARTGLSESHATAAYKDLIEAGDTFVTDLRVECKAMHDLIYMSQLPQEQKGWAAWNDVFLHPIGLTDKECQPYE